ncbi:MAG: phospholipase D-like domain-containing protein, partial [Gemmatimonadota bacterium]|nr:phospholipase D-like domain-containing protein [Gemmatimonadota bacterium]
MGPVLYVLFGINRIKRLAGELRSQSRNFQSTTAELARQHLKVHEVLPPGSEHLDTLGTLVDRVTRVPVTDGNEVKVLVNGDQAYPEMCGAIDEARHTVALGTYIFDRDEAGEMFADALERAVKRNVTVRVLIDGVGAAYSWPSMVRNLRNRGIKVERFLHSWVPWRMPFMNLRSHRKILVTDGEVGFAGGMNIRKGHLLAIDPQSPIQDLHFRFDGPVVAHLMEVFAADWGFSTGESLTGPDWFPVLKRKGKVVARGIADGPDEDFDQLRWTLLGALARAQRSVRILTPYFLPDSTLITAINLACLRGVDVEIVLPEVSNLRFVSWATNHELWQVLVKGARVYASPPPFDHGKLMIVDGIWSLVGSANWDPRSLRLNFEFNVECYDADLARELEGIIADRIASGRQVTRQELNDRSLPVKLRDGLVRLFKPYL